MSDFLIGTLPAVDAGDYFLIYTYYHGRIVRIDKTQFDEAMVIDKLKKAALWVEPKGCPGDYSDCVELVISLTNACNLHCKYCFIGEEGSNVKDISFESIDKSLLSIGEIAKVKNKRRIYIQFFGGEPTLRPNLMVYTINRAKELLAQYDVEYGITTNGVFTEEIDRLLLEHHFTTTISMDGLPLFQDEQRVYHNGTGSSRAVERSIKSLTTHGIKVIVRITVTNYMISSFREIVDYLHDLGVKFIHFEPVTKGGRANSLDVLRPDPDEYAKKLMDVIAYAKQFGVYILTSTLMNAMSPSLCFCDAVGKNKLAVTYEGLLTSCLGVQSEEHPLAQQFVMKTSDPHAWLSAQFPSYVSTTSCLEQCKNCFARYICAGGCPSRNFYANQSIEKVDTMQCITTQRLLHYYIISLYENSSQ